MSAAASPRKHTGKWSVRDGHVTYEVFLPNGDPMRMKYKVDKVNAYELVESSSGVDSRVQASFKRVKAGKTPASATSPTR